ncbi:uncharacterized protein LOC114537564 [Dendronephthya gigantea]|uniref:uncharacterized protein LOC114537564 n=1 Tax=Dendronephthya gigantea TaxID=151771 RepID=UPI001069D0D2|nr:uncharacterized protein LOC114537564 [Dendronephthya gigantea]
MYNPRFPSFNFPYTPSEDLRQFLVDYGRTGAVHIFKHSNDFKCIPQKKENENIRTKLVSQKPTLPLNIPGPISSELNREESGDCEQELTNLTADYSNVVFNGLAKLVSEEFTSLSSCLPSYRHLQRLAKYDPELKKFQTDFCDIPCSLLTDLVLESEVEQKAIGKYYGNCLGYTCSTRETDTVLVYPGGLSMNELCFGYLKTYSQNKEAKFSAKGSFDLKERICEIATADCIDQNGLIAVRTHQQCWLFSNTEGIEKTTFLGNLKCKSRPCAISVSPYIPEEVVVAMETGSLWLCHAEDNSVQVARKSSACTPEEFDWYFSKFGSHPRQVVRGTATSVELIDMREGSSRSQDLITLPSSHFFPNDTFSSIQHHYNNPYHFILATTQSLAVIDQRFQQHPLLKWCHSLEHPPKYINVAPDPTSEETLVFLGCYENHDVHCFQYCSGEKWNSPLGMMDHLTAVLPPRSTSNPWKVSSYSEWPEMVDYPRKAQSYPEVTKRLNQPLLGLSCIPESEGSSLTVVQLSSTGDLFYQSLAPRESQLTEVRDEGRVQYYEDFDSDAVSSGGCGSKQPNLGVNDHKFITHWVECLMKQTDKESKKRLDENFDKSCEDVGIIREEIFSSLETEVQCSLCLVPEGDASCNNKKIAEANDTLNFSNETLKTAICPFCKLTRKMSAQLFNTSRRQNKVLSKLHLGLNYEPETLHMFNEAIPCSEPLGKTLLRNWHSNEQVSIDLIGTQDNETVEASLEDKTSRVNTECKETQSSVNNNKKTKNEKSPPKIIRLEIMPTTAQEEQAASPGTLFNQDVLIPKNKTNSPLKEPKTPGTPRTTDLSQGNIQDKFGDIGSPKSSHDTRPGISFDNPSTPDYTTSARGEPSQETITPSLNKSPLNIILSPSTPRSQRKTPTKKKISRIPGF